MFFTIATAAHLALTPTITASADWRQTHSWKVTREIKGQVLTGNRGASLCRSLRNSGLNIYDIPANIYGDHIPANTPNHYKEGQIFFCP